MTQINSGITTDTNMTAVSRYAPFKLRFSPGRSVEMMSMMTFSTAVFCILISAAKFSEKKKE